MQQILAASHRSTGTGPVVRLRCRITHGHIVSSSSSGPLTPLRLDLSLSLARTRPVLREARRSWNVSRTTWQIRQVHLDHPVALFKRFQAVVFLVGIRRCRKWLNAPGSAVLGHLIEIYLPSPTVENQSNPCNLFPVPTGLVLEPIGTRELRARFSCDSKEPRARLNSSGLVARLERNGS
jgi:hypothetical protein